MNKGAFWKRDWFLGMAITLVMLLLAFASPLIERLETTAYDFGVRASTKSPSDRIAVIAIDDQSIANIGRWPWHRDVVAKVIDQLAAAKSKVIGNTIFYFEPQVDPGLTYINKLAELYGQAFPGEAFPAGMSPVAADIGKTIREAQSALNADERLAQSVKAAGNVVLPVYFELGQPKGRPDKPLPDYVSKYSVAGVVGRTGDLLTADINALVPIPGVGVAAAGIGHLTPAQSSDGGIRAEPLIIDYFGQQFPALSLMVAAQSQNLGAKDIKINLGEAVQLGKLRIKTGPDATMRTHFYRDRDGRAAIAQDSFFDVYSGKISPEKYRDKIVLIGATAAGVGNSAVTPVGSLAPVEVLAHNVSSILQQHYFITPAWALWVEWLLVLLVAAYLIAVLPRLSAAPAAMLTVTMLVLLLLTHYLLMKSGGVWMKLMLPAALLVAGHVLFTTKRFFVTEKVKEKAEGESAESNRMLGLAFQQQGQLDMAFDKFRKCPVDEQLLENLYGLALDFERRRQFNKAENVFTYMANQNPKFRDVSERLQRARQMAETVVLGRPSTSRDRTVAMTLAGAEKPMLGRYQIEKELGKGAMGVVYQGRDPKIGRVVAIKTLELSAEFDGDELEEAKRRFFREAETAGALTHPNIVTIYDAGEEQDLAYIAMELLRGKDLTGYIRQPNLLPLPKVLSIVERIAMALAYAHSKSVVHRDIKPANIMWEPESDTVKVTDFGIARVTDSSRTRTGMVLGTPSYMSPEQLAGRRIDGRSDLFSLGVMLYQLASGRLPFQAESMTQLMYCIANEPHAPIQEVNPAVPVWLNAVLDHALAKDFNLRFQTGVEFAQALRGAEHR